MSKSRQEISDHKKIPILEKPPKKEETYGRKKKKKPMEIER